MDVNPGILIVRSNLLRSESSLAPLEEISLAGDLAAAESQ